MKFQPGTSGNPGGCPKEKAFADAVRITGLRLSGLRAGIGQMRTRFGRLLSIRLTHLACTEFNPHSFRHALATLGEKLCRNAEEMKAWSQNLGHSGVLTTLTSYGPVAEHRQAALIKALCIRPSDRGDDIAARVADAVRRELGR